MRAVFVLLTAYAILNVLANFVVHIQELVVPLNKFHCPCDTRVSVERVVIMAAYNFFF